jgi:hypothetical protein
MKRKKMSVAIAWFVIIGPLLIGGGLSIWGFGDGNRTFALWIGFSGCFLLLLAAALQLQQNISQAQIIAPIGNIDAQTKRAYVVLDQFHVQVLDNIVRIQPQWRNTGATPTKDMTNHVNWKVFPQEPPENYSFPDLSHEGKETKRGEGNISTYIGPNGATALADPLVIPTQYLDMLRQKKGRIFIWGWTEYRDVFPGTPVHRTEFCNEIVMEFSKDVGTTSAPKVQAGLSFSLYRRHNCMDEDCEK